MANAEVIPPPPAGFDLDAGTPPPPNGFEVDAPVQIRAQAIDPNGPGGFNYGGTRTRIHPDTALGEDFWHDFVANASRPAVPIPKMETKPNDSIASAVAKTAGNLLLSLPEFAESPLGIASLASGTVAPRVVAGAFLADTAKGVVQGARDAGQAWDGLTPGQKAATVTQLAGQTALAAALAHGASGKVVDAIEAKVQPAVALAKQLDREPAPAPRPDAQTAPVITEGQPAPAPVYQFPAAASFYEHTPPSYAGKALTEVLGGVFRTKQGFIGSLRESGGRLVLDNGQQELELNAPPSALVGEAELRAVSLADAKPKEPGQYPPDPMPILSRLQTSRNVARFAKLADDVQETEAPPAAATPSILPELHETSQNLIDAVTSTAANKKAPLDQLYGALQAAPTALRILQGHIGRLEQAGADAKATEPFYQQAQQIEAFENNYLDTVTKPDRVRGPASTAQVLGKAPANVPPPPAGFEIDNPASQAQSSLAGAETITGANVREGTEMPAEPGANASSIPGPNQPRFKVGAAVQRSLDRPYDLIDHALDNIGKIDPTLIRQADPNWQPVGAARQLFRKGGTAADVAANALQQLGAFKGDAGQPDQLGAAFNAAALGRKGDRAAAVKEKQALRLQSKQAEQFGKRVLQGERPKAQANKVERVPVGNLLEGDTFEVQGHKFTVEKMDFDQDGDITHVTLKDGPKFGVQQLDGTEMIHLDKGTLQTKGQALEFLSPEDLHSEPAPAPEVPKLRPGETGTGSLLQTDEPFNLAGEKGIDPERVAREQQAKAEASAANEKFQAENTGDLFNKPGNRVAGFGGKPRPQKVTAPAAVAATPAPSVSPLRTWFNNQATGIKSLFGPQAISPEARGVGNALRHFMGENAVALARADEALKPFRKEFDQTPVPANWQHDPAQPLPHNYAVIDALERDPSQLPARYQELAKLFHDEFAWRIAEIQKFAPDALQNLIQNYFPHIWQDPKRASGVMAQVSTRLFAGRKEFLKQRTLPFFRDGLEQGLKPISDNPVDLLIAKMHSMDKFLLALKAQAEFKASGAMRFKYIFSQMPEGWRIVDDPAFTVQRPPTVEITEAFDRFQREKLGDALRLLGVSYKRVASLGGDRWAEAHEAGKEIRAKVGAHEPTLWHELGHHMDWQFPQLRQLLQVRGKSPIAEQLRKLADLRAEGTTPSKSHKAYLRSTEEKMAELARAYVHAPDLFQREAPDVYRTFDKFLDTQPQLKHIFQDMRRGRLAMGDETTKVDLGGMLQMGHWIMPEGPAQVIENYLSPGMSRFAPYRSFKAASNILNAAQLGLSGFHLGFTSLDAATSRMAIGLEDLSRGHAIKAAKTFASVPVSPVTNILQGRRMMNEALHPGSTDAETAALVTALEQGGGRIGQDRFWQTDFVRRLKRAWHEGTATGYLKAIPLAPLSAIEVGMKPIMEYVVPRQKLGVFADMARRELERLGPNASIEDTREAMRKAWDSVDNRMGQVVYDNLFYNRIVKDLALASFRAYGWQLGKYREGFGAVADTLHAAGDLAQGKRPEVSHRMAYAMALPLMVGTIGAAMNYLMTGQRPNDWKDYFMPRTGELDANGNAARLHLPTYMKDVIAYGKHPVTSVGHSLNPMFSVLGDLLSNKDFYDTQIRNPDDPLWQQGSDVAKFALKQFIPFSLTGTQKLRELNAPLHQQILPFFGVTPVPQRITMTPAQELAAEITAANLPAEPRTKEQYDKSKLIREIVQDFRNGQNTAGRTAMAQGFQTHQLDARTVNTILDKLEYTPLQFQIHHMDIPASMRVWRVANPGERQQLTPMIVRKLATNKNLEPAALTEYVSELRRNAQ